MAWRWYLLECWIDDSMWCDVFFLCFGFDLCSDPKRGSTMLSVISGFVLRNEEETAVLVCGTPPTVLQRISVLTSCG
jgi:hypothetical protein